jgi:hypothetical protein
MSFPQHARPAAQISEEQLRIIHRAFAESLLDFCHGVLRVKPREGGERRQFTLRPAQRWLHAQLDGEVRERGYVRALLPKARQLGVSTYTAARFYHRVTHSFGTSCYILAHKSEATTHLFNIVKSFHGDVQALARALPMFPAPEISASNARELVFPELRSNYKVGTAEGKDVGVGSTNQLLHLSEIALYQDTAGIAAGLMGTVHLLPGTEIIMESTGRGPQGTFYSMCQQALEEQNKGLYRLYFLPWFWDSDYRAKAPENWEPPIEFVDYANEHKLDIDQLYWFYLKNQQMATMYSANAFEVHRITRQEYPATLDECFQSDSASAFFAPEAVARAIRSGTPPTEGLPRILAVDPAGDGPDMTWLCDRQGLALGSRVWRGVQGDLATQADIIANIASNMRMQAIIVDATGLGIGLVSLLRMKAPPGCAVIPVIFSQKPLNPRNYANRRAELHDLFRLWLNGEGSLQPSIPNDAIFLSDMAAYKFKQGECYRDANNLLHMTAKEKIRETNGGRSPDRLDSAILTTAFMDDHLARLARL